MPVTWRRSWPKTFVKRNALQGKFGHGVGSMKISRFVFSLAVAALAATFGAFAAQAQASPPVEARNVVLVHGAWADGSTWAEVIPLLHPPAFKITAVQTPPTSR